MLANPLLSTKSLTYYHKDIKAIDRVNFELYPGEIHALIGNHGEGKTLLCQLLSGDIEPDQGLISLQRSVEQGNGRDSLEVVWKAPAIYEQLTVGENLVLGTQDGWRRVFATENAMIRKAQRWLEKIDVELPAHKKAYTLSLSDKVVLSILRRLYRRPKVLILDQALENLAPKSMKKLTSLLREHADRGNAVLWVTHNLDVVSWLADRLSIFRQGKIIFTEVTTGLVRNNLIELCYAHLNDDEDSAVMKETSFHDMLYYMDAMLQKLPLPIIMIDKNDSVVYSNLVAKNFLHEEFSGANSIMDVFSSLGLTRFIELLKEHVIKGESINATHPVILFGMAYVFNIRVQYISDEAPEGGRIIILEDVTMEENIREQANLSANLSALGLLAAGVSHEINNPLGIIENYASYLASEVRGGDSVQAVRQIREEVQEIHRITNNLKAFSGTDAVESEIFDISESVNYLITLLRFEAKKREVDILWEAPGRAILVDASRAEIRQVLLNLFNNSFDALESNGFIKVTLDTEADDIILAIEDNGCGIPFENAADIFMPFNSTKKSTGTNHGLGLSIVYNLIQRHKGRIAVENLQPRGCRFTISFPLVNSKE